MVNRLQKTNRFIGLTGSTALLTAMTLAVGGLFLDNRAHGDTATVVKLKLTVRVNEIECAGKPVSGSQIIGNPTMMPTASNLEQLIQNNRSQFSGRVKYSGIVLERGIVAAIGDEQSAPFRVCDGNVCLSGSVNRGR